MKKYIGIDLGGTNIVAGVVDEDFKILMKHSTKTRANRSFEEIVKSIADVAEETLSKCNLSWSDITAVGMGTPSCINPKTGLLVNANNLNWKNKPIYEELEKYIKVPLFIKNDADCAALGETLAGAAKEYDNALMVTLGTGVGGGMVINNEIFSGCDQMGMEIGHTKLIFEGERCTCEQYGCFESYASATALIRQTKEAIAENPNSLLIDVAGNLDNIDAETAFLAAKKGDETALKVVDKYTSYIAAGLSSLITVFRPQVIIIGGGVGNQGQYLLQPLNKKIFELTFAAEEIGVPQAIEATLGNDAGIIGAAMLGRNI